MSRSQEKKGQSAEEGWLCRNDHRRTAHLQFGNLRFAKRLCQDQLSQRNLQQKSIWAQFCLAKEMLADGGRATHVMLVCTESVSANGNGNAWLQSHVTTDKGCQRNCLQVRRRRRQNTPSFSTSSGSLNILLSCAAFAFQTTAPLLAAECKLTGTSSMLESRRRPGKPFCAS